VLKLPLGRPFSQTFLQLPMGKGGKRKGSPGKGGGRGGGRGGGGGEKKKARTSCEEQAPKEGERGFLVQASSCEDALRGAKDLRLWLEVEAEPEAENAVAIASATSIASGLAAELAELKEGGADSRRFLAVGMVCKQVAFLRAQDDEDVPTTLARRFFGPKAERPFVSRFADRVLPVDGSSLPKAENFATLARDVLEPHRGKPWRLVYEAFRGGWNTISRDDALKMCKDILSEDNQSVSEPEVTVLCTVSPRFVGLSAMLALDAEDLQVPFDSEGATGAVE